MVKNFIKQKNVGDNSIKFDLSNEFQRIGQLFKYWNKNNENEILNKINYINFIVSSNLNGNEKIQLNKINNIYFNNENECLIQLLKDVKYINQIIIKENKCIDKNIIDFLINKDITSIVWNKNDIANDEYENLLKIKSIKYLILDNKIIKNYENLFKKEKFRIIPKEFFIDATYISQ